MNLIYNPTDFEDCSLVLVTKGYGRSNTSGAIQFMVPNNKNNHF